MLGECVVKINEIVVEAISANGTPNADPKVFRPNPARPAPATSQPLAQPQKRSLWNKVKATIPGTQVNAQKVQAKINQKQRDIGATTNTNNEPAVTAQQSAQPWIRLWYRRTGENPAIAQDPTALLDFAKTVFGNRIDPNTIPAPTDMSETGVPRYLTMLTDAFMKSVPTNVEQPATDTEQPAQQSVVQQRTLDPDVEVVSAVDPTILRFNGKRYTRQPNGQWTKLGQTKPLDIPMQQFLNKELKKL